MGEVQMKFYFTKSFMTDANKLLGPGRITDLKAYLTDEPKAGNKVEGVPGLYELEFDDHKIAYTYIDGLNEINMLAIGARNEDLFSSEEAKKSALQYMKKLFDRALKLFGIAKLKEILKDNWDHIEPLMEIFGG